MTKQLKQNIKRFVVERIQDIEGYSEYEYKLIKSHPEFNKDKWDEYMDDGNEKYEATVQKLIRWANKQIIAELFS